MFTVCSPYSFSTNNVCSFFFREHQIFTSCNPYRVIREQSMLLFDNRKQCLHSVIHTAFYFFSREHKCKHKCSHPVIHTVLKENNPCSTVFTFCNPYSFSNNACSVHSFGNNLSVQSNATHTGIIYDHYTKYK